MRQMTAREYSYDEHELAYVLPLESIAREQLEKLQEAVQTTPCYGVGVELKGARLTENDGLVLDYLYEGWSEWHAFTLEFEVVYLSDIQRFVLSGNILQSVHDLFELIIHRDILPEWAKTYQLKEYGSSDVTLYEK